MAEIEFIDQTLRDGQQSLWGMRMQAGMALPVTPIIDRVGYRVVDLTGSSMFEVLIKYCSEDPWAGLDLLTRSMPNTRLRAGMRANACVTFAITPDAVMDLWVRRLAAHGIRSYWIYDVLFNIDKMHRLAKVAKESGAEVAGAINFSLSPVHTDAYYAQRTAELSASPDVDTLLIYDTAGCLGPDRVGSLAAAIRSGANGKPIEIHSHNITGLSTATYLEAIRHGITIVHTASHPLANGASMPSTQVMLRNLSLLGHEHRLHTELMPPVADHFTRLARTYGLRMGTPNEFNLSAYEHQIPGGMTGTLRNQLIQHKMADRFDDVLSETAAVRKELGYPGMMTPFSQLVGTQAVLNIVTGKRYSVIPDEVIRYAVGHYGKPVAPIEPQIMDRISAAPRYRDILNHPPEQETLEDLRRVIGDVSDDELLLRAVVPSHDIARMRAAGPIRLDFPTLSSPELAFARDLTKLTSSKFLQLISANHTIELARSTS
jgi:oxaloacetate decarboxylase (Na+ extruding) subunit alpha